MSFENPDYRLLTIVLCGVVVILVVVLFLSWQHNRHEHRIMHYRLKALQDTLDYVKEIMRGLGGATARALGFGRRR